MKQVKVVEFGHSFISHSIIYSKKKFFMFFLFFSVELKKKIYLKSKETSQNGVFEPSILFPQFFLLVNFQQQKIFSR
jgi:hypothetical protein